MFFFCFFSMFKGFSFHAVFFFMFSVRQLYGSEGGFPDIIAVVVQTLQKNNKNYQHDLQQAAFGRLLGRSGRLLQAFGRRSKSLLERSYLSCNGAVLLRPNRSNRLCSVLTYSSHLRSHCAAFKSIVLIVDLLIFPSESLRYFEVCLRIDCAQF